jgi:hypothetical protein
VDVVLMLSGQPSRLPSVILRGSDLAPIALGVPSTTNGSGDASVATALKPLIRDAIARVTTGAPVAQPQLQQTLEVVLAYLDAALKAREFEAAKQAASESDARIEAERVAKVFEEMQRWIAELETGKAWLQSQWDAAQADLRQRDAHIDALRVQNEALSRTLWIRAGRRIGLVPPERDDRP